MSRQVIRARYLATLNHDLNEDAGIIIESGIITSIGRYSDLSSTETPIEIDGLLMPGLVNRHTHLELSEFSPPFPAFDTFQDWILQINSSPKNIESAVKSGINQSIKHGVTEVWDISQNTPIVRKILASFPLRVISFGECLGIGSRRDRFQNLLQQAVDSSVLSDRLSIGISPHAPYTVDESGYAQVFDLAIARGFPVMTHVAETEDESRFLLNHTGAFGLLYQQLGYDPGPSPGFYGSPVEWIRGIKPDSMPIYLAHLNYASDDDLLHLSRMNAKVIYCPRTHRYFGHPPHRWKEMLRAGIEVYLGTDSCASSPDLNQLDELRLIYPEAGDIEINRLFQMISKPISIGSSADLISFETTTNDPLREIVEDPRQLPKQVWINGNLIQS